MQRYFLHLAYDGSRYCGWQVQANAMSVQQTINEALQKLLGKRIASMGCGRTDTGVHAKEFYMHFDLEEAIAKPNDFLFRLNCVLPSDIAVFRVIPVDAKSHTRFDATQRSYEYFIHFQKDPFLEGYSHYQGFYKIDWEKIFEASALLTTYRDFTSLCLPSEDFKTNLCQLSEARWDKIPSASYGVANRSDYQMRFTITSNRFLRGMVRRIVGTMLLIGKGKMSVEEFIQVVSTQQQFRLQSMAPPAGLYLSTVSYPYISKP